MSRLSEHHPHLTGTPQSVHAGFKRMSPSAALLGWRDWRNGLTEGERGAIGAYRIDSSQINGKLRGWYAKDPAIFLGGGGVVNSFSPEEDARVISGALAKSKAPANVLVFRGVDDAAFPGGPANAVGRTIRDKGFTSTSLKRETSEVRYAKNDRYTDATPRTGTLMEIKVSEGQRAGYIEGIEGLEDAEVLLPAGSSFRITGYRNEGGLDVVEAVYL